MAYTLKFTEEGRADIRALPKGIKNWLRQQLESVEADPYGCSLELREPLKRYRSFHCGEYRIIYMIFEDLRAVSIAAVGKHDSEPLRDIYKRMEVLASDGKFAEKLLISVRGFEPPEK